MIIPFGEETNQQLQPGSIVSFDFDGTLTYWDRDHEDAWTPGICALRTWAARGMKCVICTHRGERYDIQLKLEHCGKIDIPSFIERYNLPVHGSPIYTDMKNKSDFLKAIGAVMHYDDTRTNLEEIEQDAPLIIPVEVISGYLTHYHASKLYQEHEQAYDIQHGGAA